MAKGSNRMVRLRVRKGGAFLAGKELEAVDRCNRGFIAIETIAWQLAARITLTHGAHAP